MKCRDCGGPMIGGAMKRGGTRYQCVVCGRAFTVRRKPAADATAPLNADEPNRWWHS